MNFFELTANRHSYRGKYKDIPVSREDLKKIIQAGLDAPSGCNAQTTSLIGVDDPSIMDKIKEVIEPKFAMTAPAAICVLTQRIKSYKDNCYAVQDYSAAIENMLLAIVDLGYQSCWYEGYVCAENDNGKKIAEVLGVPDDYELICMLPVGVPDMEVQRIKSPKKKEFGERAWFNGFGK